MLEFAVRNLNYNLIELDNNEGKASIQQAKAKVPNPSIQTARNEVPGIADQKDVG